jgi:hypothetical protein
VLGGHYNLTMLDADTAGVSKGRTEFSGREAETKNKDNWEEALLVLVSTPSAAMVFSYSLPA